MVTERRGAVTATAPATHRVDVQAIRGIAVLIVVAFHAKLGFSGGYVGVDVFFVISGFVITGMLTRRLSRPSGKIVFKDFYARRARRLLPLLAVMSLATLVASVLILAPTGTQQNAAKTAAAASAFSANLYLYRFGVNYFTPGNQNPFLHTWSLGVEEQTYLILPLALVLLWVIGRRLGRPRLVVVSAVLIGGLASLALTVWMMSDTTFPLIPFPVKFAFYAPVTRLWEFGVGVMVALLDRRLLRLRSIAPALSIIGVVLLLAVSVLYTNATAFPGWAAIPPVAATGLLLAAGSASERSTAWMSWRPLVWLGDRSYGWYLWHWPLIVFAGVLWPERRFPFLVAAVLSLGLTIVTYRSVEERFRRDSSIVGRRAIVLTTACIALPVVIACCVLGGANRSWWNGELKQRAVEAQRSGPELDDCNSALMSHPCYYGAGERTVTLIGDSHAGTIADVVKDVTLNHADRFGVWLRPGCPVLPSPSAHSGSPCQQWTDDVLDYLEQHPSDVVIIHVGSTGYVHPSSAGNEQDPASSYSGGVEPYVTGLGTTIDTLRRAGSEVVLISDVPRFPGSSVEFASLLAPNPPAKVRSREAVVDETRLLDDAVTDLSNQLGFTIVDPVPVLCDMQTCSQSDGAWMYRDSNHLTPYGAGKLRPSLEAVIARPHL